MSKSTCWPSLQTQRDSTTTAMSEVELANAEALKLGRHYKAAGMYMFSQPGTIDIEHWCGGRAVLLDFESRPVPRKRAGD
ncbi:MULTISPECIES: hypothetical protein [Agrobacterium]|uniref:hypothetical protein n=1 Tax=Agrobacterium TaxID=357 RepID=UPI0015739CE5|nr:hypothetical protein [Agrobacterium tumefaciens]WCJ65901.1 hypothetical protein G6M15_24060 [Agrobacterium tumefaciens]